nr:hypothetical protein [uncultured Flavobacterium sp.]
MKGIFKIKGKVSIKETGEGISNLVVHVLDIDFSKAKQSSTSAEVKLDNTLLYDSLGSIFTDEKGNFTLEFDKDDFSSVNQEDLRPELLLHVTRPEDSDELKSSFESRILYTSNPIRFKAGKIESYLIRIPEKELEKFNLNPNGANAIIQKNSSKIEKNKAIIDAKKEINKIIKGKVDTAFANFSFSKLPEHVQNSNYYYKPGDNLEEKQQAIINDKLTALASINIASVNKEMKLSFSESELRSLGLWDETNARPMSGSIPKTKVDTIIKKNSLERRTVKNCVKEFTEADLESVSNPPTPTDGTGSVEEIITTTIGEQIQMQLTSATSPETALKYEKVIDQDYKNKNVCESVNQFALCGGPADVTAYHDFQSLEIAFEHVWTELFDKDIKSKAKKIFNEIIRLDEGYQATKTIQEIMLIQKIRTDKKPFNILNPIESFLESSLDNNIPSFSTEISEIVVSTINDLTNLIKEFSPEIRNNVYLKDMIEDIEQRLSEKYTFSVFAPNSINYGVMYTFRQKWEPRNYQVGKLISSLPLAPKEVRKYSTKRVTTKSKNEKYLDDREFKGKTDSSSTSRAESEIIKRAQQTTSFGLNAGVSGDIGPISMHADTNMNTSSEKFSQDTKKNFREAVLNASEEYRKQNKSEIEFGFKDDYTTESSGEISNPNDEITVTYLFYELQRQYDISEFLHKITPVVLVANEVPMPDEIDIDWLLTNAWILKRIILDESFLPALQNLMDSPMGDTIALQNLKRTMQQQEQVVISLNSQIDLKNRAITNLTERLEGIAIGEQAADTAKQIFDLGNSILNPLSFLSGGGEAPTADKIKEFTQISLERADKESQSLIANLKQEQSTLQQIVEKYNKETREYFDKQTAITQLKIHIKENILYYMQRIWDYEPADQRFFRLYNLDIYWFEEDNTETSIVYEPISSKSFMGKYPILGKLVNKIKHVPTKRKLVEVADLDKLLGYKGNYMIFPVKEMSYLHVYMMQEFIDNATNGIKDADEFANYTTQDFIDYLKCVKLNNPTSFETEKDYVISLINERLQSTRKEKERVIIPTNSVFIEALPGKHPIMEDFKLAHRGLDVKKVQAEVRHAELENLRLAARLIEGEREDPDIEKVVINK